MSGRVTFGVEGDDLLFDLVAVLLVPFQQPGLKLAVSVPRYCYLGVAGGDPQLHAVLPVATVATVAPFGFVALIPELLGQFRFQHRFQCLGEQPGKDAALAEEVIAAFRIAQILLDHFYRWYRFLGRLALLVVCHVDPDHTYFRVKVFHLHTLTYTLPRPIISQNPEDH